MIVMSSEDESGRAAAVCDTCGAIYTVRTDVDGTIQPIGTGTDSGCTCGAGELQIMRL